MTASHRQTFDMIPWLVNGRVADDQRRALDEHVRQCAECRAELAEQERVRAAMCADSSRVEYAAGASLQKLWTRIASEQSEIPARRDIDKVNRNSRSRVMQWLVAAVVVEAIGITILAGLSLQHKNDSAGANLQPAYRTVTTTEIVPASAALRIVFVPDFTIAQMNGLLHEEHLEIVNGPSPAGVYTLATTDSGTQTNLPHTLARLHANASVRFVEPIARAAESK